MSGVRCFFVGPFPTNFPKPVLKCYINIILSDAIVKYPGARTVVIVCSEDTTPFIPNTPLLTCKLQTKIIYNLQQFIEYFSNCPVCTEYFPFLNEFGATILQPSFDIINAMWFEII